MIPSSGHLKDESMLMEWNRRMQSGITLKSSLYLAVLFFLVADFFFFLLAYVNIKVHVHILTQTSWGREMQAPN